MKRATRKFIMKQNGEATGVFAIFANIDKKKLLFVGIGILVALILGGLYLWYMRDLRDSHNLNLTLKKEVPYSWSEDYGGNKINKDYLWGATKELLINQREDNTLIVSSYLLPGTLTEQTGEESGVYLLEDQALLLRNYLQNTDALKANALVAEINSRFDLNSADTASKLTFLEVYLEYYSMYGKDSDLANIKSLVTSLFDDEGLLIPTPISVNSYINKAYVGAVDKEAALEEGGALSGAELSNNEDASGATATTYNGVLLSNIRLLMIKNLENNNLLPAGSYDKNLALVKGGMIDTGMGLYSNAYYLDNGTPVYFQTTSVPSQVDVYETILTMRNLSEVGELEASSIAWISASIASTEGINHTTYKLIDNKFSETSNNRVFYFVLQISINIDNEDLFIKTMDKLDLYRATYQNSPALHMIFEAESNGRNACYAWENLMISSIL